MKSCVHEESSNIFACKKPQMRSIHHAGIPILETPGKQQLQDERGVSNVGNAANEKTVRPQLGPQRTNDRPGINQVFQDVTGHNVTERTIGQFGEKLGNVTVQDVVDGRVGSRLGSHRLDHFDSPDFCDLAITLDRRTHRAGATAHVQDAGRVFVDQLNELGSLM